MNVVITGITGFIGAALARRLRAAGHPASGLPAGVRLGQPAPSGSFAGADLVVHGAFDMAAGSLQKNVEGTLAWALQAKAEGAKAQLLLSSMSAHAEAPSEYGRAKHALETAFLSAGERVLRLGWVVGDGGSFGRTARFVSRGWVAPVIGGDALRVHLTDMDAVARSVMGYERVARGAAANVFEPEGVTLSRVASAVRRRRGRSGFVLPVPLAPARWLLQLAQAARLKLPMSAESLAALERSQGYGYRSDYAALGLTEVGIDGLLERSCE